MSMIDRWATHPLLIKAIGSRISDEINKFPESDRDNIIILFSAHSLPLKVIYIKSTPYNLLVCIYLSSLADTPGDWSYYFNIFILLLIF